MIDGEEVVAWVGEEHVEFEEENHGEFEVARGDVAFALDAGDAVGVEGEVHDEPEALRVCQLGVLLNARCTWLTFIASLVFGGTLSALVASWMKMSFTTPSRQTTI